MAKQIFDAKKVGNSIRTKRTEMGYTQKSFAAEMKITDVYMNNVETGKHLPSGKLMKKMFDKLGMKVTITVE